jgi:tRNA1(Val) A37 N6-methylase TrmN6
VAFTPLPTLWLTCSKHIFSAETGRLLDPCAGEGIAAAILASALNCASRGAELSPESAALAAERMDRVFNARECSRRQINGDDCWICKSSRSVGANPHFHITGDEFSVRRAANQNFIM